MPHKATLGLGSNVDRQRNLCRGMDELRACFGHVLISPVYESRAFGFRGDDFLNLVVSIQTSMSLTALIARLKAIEIRHGRKKDTPKYSPRTLDIDILTFDDYVGEFGDITLPRSDILDYAFVLKPLADIEGETLHPRLDVTYAELWREFSGDKASIWPSHLRFDDEIKM